MYSVGEIISTNRKKLGLSQAGLADLLRQEGFTQTQKAVSKWEKNAAEPSVTLFFALCRILGITNIYEAYFGTNPDNPLSALSEAGKEKALDYIDLLQASGRYGKKAGTVIPFRRNIDIFENAVSAGTGNFLADTLKETVTIEEEGLIPCSASYGVKITGDSMEPDFQAGQIAWVSRQDTIASGEIGIFYLNGDAYIKKLQDDEQGVYLISLNEKYTPIRVGEDDRLDIFGKVVGKSNPSDIPNYKG